MDRSLLSPRQVAKLKRTRRRGFATARRFHDDTFTIWTKHRPESEDGSWNAGTADELWAKGTEGTGKLYENGSGGPQMGEGMIFPDSPYRFRTLTSDFADYAEDGKSAADLSHLWLVINTTRLFTVDVVKIEDVDDLLATVYIREVFGAPLPEVTP